MKSLFPQQKDKTKKLTYEEICEWIDKYRNEPWNALPLCTAAAGDYGPMQVFRSAITLMSELQNTIKADLSEHDEESKLNSSNFYATRKLLNLIEGE